MNSKSILRNVSKHINLNAEEETYFLSLLTEARIRRKEFLLRAGEVCDFSAFVVTGCLKGYSIDQNGFEHVLQFASPDWWITDMYSLITRRPGSLFIDALERTDALLLSYSNREKLCRQVPKFERFFRILAENSLVSNRQRIIDNLSLTAKQRYKKFCSVYSAIFATVPQKYVASYIGVTPEFLSKLRSEIDAGTRK
ncbi:MAG: Crp/Fnr family transcriptional regulator [Ignavibacteria bacterium]|nr:Crp/Fnr family transcriptional regulator [Ignavibacteria bacterium]